MSKITFGYIVGGEDKHYNNLLRSLESLERIEQPYEVVILDADSRLESDEDKPNQGEITTQRLYTEPNGLNIDGDLPTINKNTFKKGVYY